MLGSLRKIGLLKKKGVNIKIMLRFLIVLVVIISVSEACRSAAVKENATHKVDSTLSLPIPNPKYSRIIDPAHVIVSWDPVEVSENNPILGFKVKLWEDEKKKVIKYVKKDGKQVEVEEWVPVYKSFHELPSHKPAFISVVPPDVFSASFDVKKGVHYELRAQSYNEDGDGPLSISHGFSIYTDEETKLYESTSTEQPDGDENKVKVTVLSSNIGN